MFALGIFVGIYSYLLLSLGILGLLYKNVIILLTLFYLSAVFFYFANNKFKISLKVFERNRFIFGIILLQVLVNLVGALGPELGFDSLWYHLTLPKIFLESHKLLHIGGGLLYYSDMPKLTEMLYLLPLSTVGEIGAKLIHFSFGILALVVIYKISKKFMDERFSLISSLIFYSSLVVGWQSTTAYIDLVRTFFEVMALWGFSNWSEMKTESIIKRMWLIESAVMLGLAISAKLLSLESLVVFLILIIYSSKKFNFILFKNLLVFFLISLSIALPWFLFSFLNTGNPFYPFFSGLFKNTFEFNLTPFLILGIFWNLFTHSADPISPIYIIFLPFAFIYFKKLNHQMKIIFWFSLMSLIFWYFGSAKESRYALPAFGALSIVSSYLIYLFRDKLLKNLSFMILIVVGLSSIIYRGAANSRYLPVILGRENKSEFLTSNLNFNYGDFYDTDNYFKRHIKSSDRVLLYGFHNLFYADFPFIDSSYVKKGDKFTYIAVQKGKIPDRFSFWNEIYTNPKTGVKLYYLGGQEWTY